MTNRIVGISLVLALSAMTVRAQTPLSTAFTYQGWLEIGVRVPPGSGSYTTLTPRQPLTGTPYALQTRGIFVDSALNVGFNETSPLARVHVTGTGNLGAGFDGSQLDDEELLIEANNAWLGLYSNDTSGAGSG